MAVFISALYQVRAVTTARGDWYTDRYGKRRDKLITSKYQCCWKINFAMLLTAQKVTTAAAEAVATNSTSATYLMNCFPNDHHHIILNKNLHKKRAFAYWFIYHHAHTTSIALTYMAVHTCCSLRCSKVRWYEITSVPVTFQTGLWSISPTFSLRVITIR